MFLPKFISFFIFPCESYNEQKGNVLTRKCEFLFGMESRTIGEGVVKRINSRLFIAQVFKHRFGRGTDLQFFINVS